MCVPSPNILWRTMVCGVSSSLLVSLKSLSDIQMGHTHASKFKIGAHDLLISDLFIYLPDVLGCGP